MHILVSAALRQKDHIAWFEKTCPLFVLIGRFILENRVSFVHLHQRFLAEWMSEQEKIIPDSRQRFVYGVSYSCFEAAMVLLCLDDKCREELYDTKMLAVTSSREGWIESDVTKEVNRFWDDVMTLFHSNLLEAKWFQFTEIEREHPPNFPNQGVWTQIIMHFLPDPIIKGINEMRTRSKSPKTLSRADLRSQMRHEMFWMKTKSVRFASAVHRCWSVNLDYHPLGRRDVSDEMIQEYLALSGQEKEKQGDPSARIVVCALSCFPWR